MENVPSFCHKTRNWGIWLRLSGQMVEYKVSGPQGSCLSHLAPQDLLGPVLPFFFFQSCGFQASSTTGPVRGQEGSWACVHRCVSVLDREEDGTRLGSSG